MTRTSIDRFLGLKRIAMVGVSRSAKDFSRMLFRDLVRHGYDVVPVHPEAADVEGRKCFGRVQDIEPKVEGALLMTSPNLTGVVVRDCAEAGVKLVWMYRAVGAGAVSGPAVEFCEAHGIDCIVGHCPYMFLANSGFPHNLHGWLMRITGKFPKAA